MSSSNLSVVVTGAIALFSIVATVLIPFINAFQERKSALLAKKRKYFCDFAAMYSLSQAEFVRDDVDGRNAKNLKNTLKAAYALSAIVSPEAHEALMEFADFFMYYYYQGNDDTTRRMNELFEKCIALISQEIS